MLTLLCSLSRALSSNKSKMASQKFSGPRPLVICGPSGSGKSTLLKKLFKEFPNTFGFSTSHTTRKPRSGEQDGHDYYFVTIEEMENAIASGEFIEHAKFAGNYYGTSKKAVEKVQNTGKVCVLDIDSQGVEQIRNTNLNPILIFNNPPSIKILEERIRKRNTETDETLQRRLDEAIHEISYGLKPGNFHKVILNDDIDSAYKEFRDFIIEMLKEQQSEGVQILLN